MKQLFQNAFGVGAALAILGISLSVAAAAIGSRWHPEQQPVYVGQQFEKEQRALRSKPAEEATPTF